MRALSSGADLGQGRARPPQARGTVLAVMDGQVQWSLDRDAVDLGRTTAFAIEAILPAAVVGHDRR